MKATKVTIVKIEIGQRIDHLKGNWYEWSCTAEMPDGTLVEGTVQADGTGEGMAVETFAANE